MRSVCVPNYLALLFGVLSKADARLALDETTTPAVVNRHHARSMHGAHSCLGLQGPEGENSSFFAVHSGQK